MPLVVQMVFEYWPMFGLLLLALVVFLAWLTWKAHMGKVTTGNEGLIGEEGIYKGNNLVHVHGELWKTDGASELEPGDVVTVKSIHKLIITVEKQPLQR